MNYELASKCLGAEMFGLTNSSSCVQGSRGDYVWTFKIKNSAFSSERKISFAFEEELGFVMWRWSRAYFIAQFHLHFSLARSLGFEMYTHPLAFVLPLEEELVSSFINCAHSSPLTLFSSSHNGFTTWEFHACVRAFDWGCLQYEKQRF